ncbi:uncharacterized protein C2845_PM08G18030 [Panicum miliaceum]|uniref:Uncharacterized protein n=1 Tax=Panicum miliaceum TaxID=4540 RepID=A0A3L6R1G7_PANMI|nr:uncharacterized protein C2845_PM08G18030 [Panicum miliaceum]
MGGIFKAKKPGLFFAPARHLLRCTARAVPPARAFFLDPVGFVPPTTHRPHVAAPRPPAPLPPATFHCRRPSMTFLPRRAALREPSRSRHPCLAWPTNRAHYRWPAALRCLAAPPARCQPLPGQSRRAIADHLAALLDLAAPNRIARAVPGFCALSLPNCCNVLE